MFRFSSQALATAAVTLVTATALHAALPANDRISRSTAIGALPFTDVIDTRFAVTDRRDPDCAGQGATVWYELTPATDTVEANTIGGALVNTVTTGYEPDTQLRVTRSTRRYVRMRDSR